MCATHSVDVFPVSAKLQARACVAFVSTSIFTKDPVKLYLLSRLSGRGGERGTQ